MFIASFGTDEWTKNVALLAEGVDRNISACWSIVWSSLSPSSRRAWIEILLKISTSISVAVALLAEGVDRNAQICEYRIVKVEVALLAEGVDRNPPVTYTAIRHRVALLAEGVDRNSNIRKILAMLDKVALLAEGVDRNLDAKDDPQRLKVSPSSRRAWIEIRFPERAGRRWRRRPPRGGRG